MTPDFVSLLADPEPNWQLALDTAITEFKGSTGTLHRLDSADNLLKLVVQRGLPEQIMNLITTIPIGKGIAGAAAARLEPVELCNLQVDLGGVAKEGARQTNVKGSLAVPCLHQGKLRGTLGIGLMTPHDFTDAEKNRLMIIASVMADKM